MALPNLNREGELPEGIHKTTIDEVVSQFGSGTPQREIVTACLQKICQLAKSTGYLPRRIFSRFKWVSGGNRKNASRSP